MEPDERVKNEELRPQRLDRLLESSLILAEIEAHGWGGDRVDVEGREGHTGRTRDPLQAAAHDVRCVLGGEQENSAGLCGKELPKGGRAGGDRDGDVEGEE